MKFLDLLSSMLNLIDPCPTNVSSSDGKTMEKDILRTDLRAKGHNEKPVCRIPAA